MPFFDKTRILSGKSIKVLFICKWKIKSILSILETRTQLKVLKFSIQTEVIIVSLLGNALGETDGLEVVGVCEGRFDGS